MAQTKYLPLTNGQRWCMSEMQKIKRPGWYNIEFMMKTKQPMDEVAISKSVYYLVNKYESLRVKLTEKNEEWVQEVYPLSEADPFVFHDLFGLEREVQLEQIKQCCIKERDELLPTRGNLVRIIYFRLSADEGRIWFCFHHMVSDFVSILIFSTEFMAVYNSVLRQKELKWEVTTDYRRWLYLLEGYSRDIMLPSEVDYWASLPWDKSIAIPTDYPGHFNSKEVLVDAIRHKKITETYRLDTYWLAPELTQKLLAKSGAELEGILIAVFFLAIVQKKNMDWLDLNVCNAGRNILPAEYNINVNGLLGFLATTRALLLKRPVAGNLSDHIREVIGQINSVPNAGIGFILISNHIRDQELKQKWFDFRQVGEVFFNYLGRVNTNFINEYYEVAEEDIGLNMHKPEIRNNLLACDMGIKQRQLFINISYSDVYFKESTIAEMVDAMMMMFKEIVSGELIAKVA